MKARVLRQKINEAVDSYRRDPDIVMDDVWVMTLNAAFGTFEQPSRSIWAVRRSFSLHKKRSIQRQPSLTTRRSASTN